MNRRARCLKSGLVRLTICQTIARSTLDGKVRSFPVVDAQRNAVRVTEVKFREIAEKVLPGAMLILAKMAGYRLNSP